MEDWKYTFLKTELDFKKKLLVQLPKKFEKLKNDVQIGMQYAKKYNIGIVKQIFKNDIKKCNKLSMQRIENCNKNFKNLFNELETKDLQEQNVSTMLAYCVVNEQTKKLKEEFGSVLNIYKNIVNAADISLILDCIEENINEFEQSVKKYFVSDIKKLETLLENNCDKEIEKEM